MSVVYNPELKPNNAEIKEFENSIFYCAKGFTLQVTKVRNEYYLTVNEDEDTMMGFENRDSLLSFMKSEGEMITKAYWDNFRFQIK